MKVQINTKIINGKITNNRESFIRSLIEFNNKEITITIERKRRKRSNEQNAYLWCCIYPLIKQGFFETCGEVFTINEVHEIMKLKFNFIELTNESTGEVITAPKSTTKNTKFEQEQYHEQCRQFALEWFNITIPLPNEQIEIKL
jgi:hypothetical protein